MHKLLLTGLVASFISNDVYADRLLKVQEFIHVNAKASDVWERISDFSSMDSWHPAVSTTALIEGENNQKGAVRVLTLQDGGTVTERLINHQPGKQKYTTAIVDGALPVSAYQSYITVRPVTGNMSRVVWHGRFKSSEEVSDDEALKTISGVYRDGLENLKLMAETEAVE